MVWKALVLTLDTDWVLPTHALLTQERAAPVSSSASVPRPQKGRGGHHAEAEAAQNLALLLGGEVEGTATRTQNMDPWGKGDSPSRPKGHNAERGSRGAGDRRKPVHVPQGRVEGDRGGGSSQEAPRGALNPLGMGPRQAQGRGRSELCCPHGSGFGMRHALHGWRGGSLSHAVSENFLPVHPQQNHPWHL